MHFCCNEWHSHLKNEEDDPTTELLRGAVTIALIFKAIPHTIAPVVRSHLRWSVSINATSDAKCMGLYIFPLYEEVSFPFPKILVNQDCNCTNADQKSRHCTCGTGQPPKVENVAAASSQFPRNVAKIYEGQPIWVVGVPFLLDYDF